MKKVGTYTVRGTFAANKVAKRINVFDGDYTTGYKITRIAIAPVDVDNTGARNFSLKVMTTPNVDTPEEWNWNNTQEVAWALFAQDANGIFPQYYFEVDRTNLIIEDCYIIADEIASSTASDVNYIIEFDKYELPPYRGSLAIVQNSSQG
ncbi:MAG: hypothetical protein VXA46_05990 [Aquiluna sp.]